MLALSEYINNVILLRIVFLTIEFFNIALFFYSGLKIRYLKRNEDYWKYASLPIVSYSLCRGLRFGRGVDYNAYYDVYYSIGQEFDSTNHELLFKAINWLMYQLGLSYQTFIFLCSLLLIWVLMIALKDYKKAAPLILLYFLYETRNAGIYIRWYLGFSFFFLSYLSLIRRKITLFILYTVFSVLMHLGCILLTPVLLLFYKLGCPVLPSPIVVGLLFLSIVLGGVHLLEGLIPYLEFVSMWAERTQGYTDRFEELINGDWGTGINRFSLFASIRIFLQYFFPIIYAPSLIKSELDTKSISLNFFYIGVIILPIFNSLELFDRYSMAFMFFSVFICGTTYYKAFKKFKNLSVFFQLSCLIGFSFSIYAVFAEIIYQSRYWFNMLFIWDAGNLKTLPIWVFHMYD